MPRLPPVTRATFPFRSIFTPASPPTSLCLHEARHLIGGSHGGAAPPGGDSRQQPRPDGVRAVPPHKTLPRRPPRDPTQTNAPTAHRLVLSALAPYCPA